jgi:hypothetical protein
MTLLNFLFAYAFLFLFSNVPHIEKLLSSANSLTASLP